MINEQTIASVVLMLQSVAQEPSLMLRRALLDNTVNQASEEELELLNLILSFQIASLLNAHTPRFNTLLYEDLDKHIIEWLDSSFDKSSFYSLPYLVQMVVYFMSDVATLHLKVKDVYSMVATYIDPYNWLAQRVSANSGDTNPKCHFCGLNDKIEDELCSVCKANIAAWTDYRNTNFEVVINKRNCTWTTAPNESFGDFSFIYNNFKIYRYGDSAIIYELTAGIGKPRQQQLPFSEYQKDI